MPYRPDPANFDQPLSKEELETYTYKLSSLAPQSVYREYERLYEECKLSGDRLPRATSVQQLVAVWRFLRSRRRGRSVH